VLVPIMESPTERDNVVGVDGPQTVGIDVFGTRVPVPMVVPGRTYGEDIPWFYSEQ
jgi:hypothetical protein